MSKPKSRAAQELEDQLIDDIASFTHDPLGYALYAFPWGEGELDKFTGPDDWQAGILDYMGQRLRAGIDAGQVASDAIQVAIASGHGIGKSALVSIIILWAMSTCEDTKGVVTANTESQLKTKTWAELAKWHRLCLCSHWFEFTATALFSKDPAHEKTWRIDMVPWSERNTEAFAGLHNKGKRILIIFDEASAIADLIWEVTEGALTDADTEIIWCAFGNPTRNTGRFRDCFRRFRHRWHTKQIDSRTVKMTNKTQLAKWVEDYGEDSDFVRVRVRGVFPETAANALLGPEDYERATQRFYRADQYQHAAKILGVDVARQGSDRTVIFPRQGLVAFKPKILRIPDTMQVAQIVAQSADKWGADAIFVDGTGGYGAGVIDRLRQLGYVVHEIQFSSRATNPHYFNKRSEMAFECAKAIKADLALPDIPDLEVEACAQTYRFQGDKFRLSEKDEIKEEIGESPDLFDALMLTYAFPVAPKTIQQQFETMHTQESQGMYGRAQSGQIKVEYDPFAA